MLAAGKKHVWLIIVSFNTIVFGFYPRTMDGEIRKNWRLKHTISSTMFHVKSIEIQFFSAQMTQI